MSFAAGSKVRLTNPDAHEAGYTNEYAVASIDALNPELFDVAAAQEQIAAGDLTIIKLEVASGDMGGFLAAVSEGLEPGPDGQLYFHVGVPTEELEAVEA